MDNRTIAAIATGMTPAGIGIIRISGDDSFNIALSIFRNAKNEILKSLESHKVYYGFVCDGDKIIDEVILLAMKGPKSFTGEDVIELQCHGGIFVQNTILDVVLKNGAVIAEPGEFTKRAFINGRIDLSKAEAVMDIISSSNNYALSNSVKQLSGKLFDIIFSARAGILNEIAFIEAALDDPEHYELDGYSVRLRDIIDSIINTLTKLSDSFNDGRILSEGLKTVILGKPNVGKSSFLNLLLGLERAIVTDIAGTTRDTLEEKVIVNGITLNVFDTAGIHESDDIVEKIGIDKALGEAKSADLIIVVIDGSCPLTDQDLIVFDFIREYHKKSIILVNKNDLGTVVNINDLANDFISVIPFSAKFGIGIDEFKDFITQNYINGNLSYNNEIFISNKRHKEALDNAINSLMNVCDSIDNDMPEDFYTIDMTDAYSQLGFIIGEETSDDVINEVFAKFCMGK